MCIRLRLLAMFKSAAMMTRTCPGILDTGTTAEGGLKIMTAWLFL